MVPKFNLTTVNLTADLRTARADLGACDFGERDDAQVFAMLEIFRQIDPVQNHAAEPQIVIESPNGKFLVRTGQGKLYLYNARDTTEPYVELNSSEILREILRPPPSSEEAAGAASAAAARRTPHKGIAISILAAGLLLNGYTLYSVFYIDDINEKPAIKLVTDNKEASSLQSAVAGRYATGSDPGDRAIDVGADGRVRFLKRVAGGEKPDGDDTYRVGRHDSQLCLTTRDSGVIDIQNSDTIVYYRDTYRRVH